MRLQHPRRGGSFQSWVIGAMTIFLGTRIASASQLQVPGQFATIQSAISAAQNGDEVVVAPGVYSGAGNTNISFGGKAITVRGSDPLNPVIGCDNK